VYVRPGRAPRSHAEDKTDDGVWAVTCFVARTAAVSHALARAVDFARSTRPARRSACVLEGYPMIM
jgi:hypothetical protein